MELISERRNGIVFITLNRPAALNALSLSMIDALTTLMHDAAADPAVRAVLVRGAGDKAFCAGGDIRALYASHRSGGTLHHEFFAREYPLDYFLHHYPKPYVVLLDGIVMGGGMGLAQGSRLRIVGERTRMAMPEVAIGFFPDVGASYFLSRLPGKLGLYLALTGLQIKAADAIYANLADIYLGRSAVAALDAALAAISWGEREEDAGAIARAVGALATDPGPASLAGLRPAIDAHFDATHVTDILASLAREACPQFQPWADSTRRLIESRSPTMLVTTQRQLALGARMTLADCLRMEIGMANRCFAQGDFIEGVRAMVIDKDNAPQWRPPTLADVQSADIDRLFTGPWSDSVHPLADIEH